MSTTGQLIKSIENSNTSKQITQLFVGYFDSLVTVFEIYRPVILLLLGTSLVLILGYYLFRLLVKILLIKAMVKQKYVLFEVKPLQETLQSSYTTQQLFTLIHGLAQQRSFWSKFLNNNKQYAFEIVATKEQGIKYLIRVNHEDAELFQKSLLSYLPGLRITEVQDYLADHSENEVITELKLSHHFAFPLKRLQVLDEYDPMAYITGNMTKLETDELMVFQVVVSPLNKSSQSDLRKISQLLYTNKDLLSNIGHSKSNILLGLLSLLIKILTFPLGIVIFLLSDGRQGPLLRFSIDKPQDKTNNPYQTELETLIKQKLDQQLFNTSVRFLIRSPFQGNAYTKKRGFLSALSSFNNAGYQSLVAKKQLPISLLKKLASFTFKNRLLGLFNPLVLSVSEVGDLYHFPFTTTTKTEDLVKSYSKELPAPLSFKGQRKLDITFAQNTYGGNSTLIGLDEDERRRHMYILGATGTGKSTLLLSMINQDMKNAKGLCVIDPHGDLIEKVLQCVPEERIKDVIYFNPDDIGYPIGLNLLEPPVGGDEDEQLREKELITESIISLFHKLYSDRNTGPRMEYILRNTIHTAFSTPNPTLFTIYKLLTNGPFRTKVVKNLKDENLIDFWKHEFSKAGDYQKVSMIMPITNKIGRFLFSSTAKRILEQEKSTINFENILDSGKILLCNLSKGKIGEDNSEVLGILLMTKIQLAALRRARKELENRRDFYLYVDEFQNFATPAFAQILSEARKYRLNAILAHQTTSQLEDKSLVHVTLANTGTVICFRTANPEDEKLILPQFIPHIQKGEIDKLPAFHFYMKINAMTPEEPFSGETLPVTILNNRSKVDKIIQSSRNHYARKYQKPESKDQAILTAPKSEIPKASGKKKYGPRTP